MHTLQMGIVSFLNDTRRKVGDVVNSFVPRTTAQMSFKGAPPLNQKSSVRSMMGSKKATKAS